MEVLVIRGSQVHLLGAIKGLLSEADRIRQEVEWVRPRVIAVSISREELQALEAYEGDGEEPSNFEEGLYMELLGRFGEVEKPPPCFVAALDAGRRLDVPVIAVDMDDETYTDAYVNRVSTLEVIGQSFRQKRLKRRKFTAESPEEFVLEFDGVVNWSDGFRLLEKDREQHIAQKVARLAGRHSPVLAVVDYERAGGVREALTVVGGQ
jgi:hypothetical protein